MRIQLLAALLLCGCTSEANHLGNPLLWPVQALTNSVANGLYGARRGAVEVAVKSNYEQILQDIASGGGPALTLAMDEAGIPESDRPSRTLQLQGDLPLYQANPGALVTTLMVYAG
jgi:hypothetical protein